MHTPWFAIHKPLPPRKALLLKCVAFLIPLIAWGVVSYVPWVWHPQRLIINAGGSELYSAEQRVEADYFDKEQASLTAANLPPMQATRVNPVFLPAPHEVGIAMYRAFWPEVKDGNVPLSRQPVPLSQRILSSIKLLFYGFILACVFAVPLGILCGTFDFFAKLIEPFVDFMRYMPAPAFGALMVAIFALQDAPKIAIIFIGLFFNMLLVTANTTRNIDVSLLEAAQTLGAKRVKLLTKVVVPGIMPVLFTDLRIALGFGWVYLTIAEIIGEMSGITEFINQQGKFRNYPNVFTGIIMLGILGFLTDQFLAWLGRVLFPWYWRRKQSWPHRIVAAVMRYRRPVAKNVEDSAPVTMEVSDARA